MEELDPTFGPVVARLQAFAVQPVPDTVQRQHLAALARAQVEIPATQVNVADVVQAGFRRVRTVAAAMVVGLLGASGLAVAGALPDPAQNLASDALGVVGLDVPRGTDDCDDVPAADPPVDDCEDAQSSGD